MNITPFRCCGVLLLLACAETCLSQVTAPQPSVSESAPEVPVGPPDKKETLRALLQTRDGIRVAIDEQRKKLQLVAGDSAKSEVQQQIEILDKRRQEVERDFTVLVTGLQSTSAANSPTQKVVPLSVQDEISHLLTPIFTDLRALTEKSRAFQDLGEEWSRLREREEQERRAVAEIDKLLAEIKTSKSPDAALRTVLNDSRKAFQGRLDEVTSRAAAVQHQLGELKITGISFWKDLGFQVKHFVFIRGTNILLALLVFMVVFFGLRTAYSYFMKIIALRKYQRLSFMLRLLDVAHEGGSLLLGISAALLVLYARGDWLLGGLSLLALGGLLMTAKSGIIRHLEQLQFLLNLGPVREGERILLAGVPWRVGTIYMFTQLTNPTMPGTILRLPLQTLASMTSRPSKLDEPWFPCSIGAWVLLNGSFLAQVSDITPEQVILSHQGGMKRCIPMANFLIMDVSILSGGFSRSISFDLPASHDPMKVAETIEFLKSDIREAMLESMRPEEIRELNVELQDGQGSSNQYRITAHFAGTAASQYQELPSKLHCAALISSTHLLENRPRQA